MEKKLMAYFRLFSFLFLLVCVCIISVNAATADDLKFYSESDPKILELCKSVEEPSSHSKSVESEIIGKWEYIGYWKDETNFISSDSLPNIVWHTLNFKKGGVVEYSYELKTRKKIVKRTGTYKFYHQGSPYKFPGRAPNVIIKDENLLKNLLKAKNILPFIGVSVRDDCRYPMPGEVLKFKDVDGKEHVFVRHLEG